MSEVKYPHAEEGGNDLAATKQTQVIPKNNVTTNSKLAFALWYARHDCSIFPCKPNSKTPAFSGWQERATSDEEAIKQWWQENPDYNIGVVAYDHIVLDVDTKPDDPNDGFASLKNHHELPQTFTVNTPSGGKHYYFEAEDPQALTICQGFEPGLDIRAGGKGYTVGAGSSIDGVSYTADCESFEMAAPPDWVLQAATKKVVAAKKPRLTVSLKQLSRPTMSDIEGALAPIDPDIGFGDWINIGMAIHSAYPDAEGLRLWDDWSAEGGKYSFGECSKHWDSFDDAGGITIGTLFHYANKYPAGIENGEGDSLILGENDTTLADAFVQMYADCVVFDANCKQWRVFDGGTWKGAEDAEKLVGEKYRAVIGELRQLIQSDRRIRISERWLNRAMNQASYASVLRIVKTRLSKGANMMDANPDLIGIQDKVYEISSGLVRPASGEDYVFKSLGASYDAAAKCPEWEQFLQTCMQGDAEMIGYLRRLVGYFLVASNAEQQIYFLYGSGANGKSTFLDLIKALLGDYSVKINSDTIMRTRSGERTNGAMANLADLAGRRLAITDEMDCGNVSFDTKTLKSVSGDDEITARYLYGNPFTFKSTAKMVMYGNDKPYGNINDEGFWRRLRFIPFEHVVPADQRDINLLQKLKDELPGILNWALLGLQEWLKCGLNTPQKVMEDSVEYRKELDTVTEFFDDNIVYEPSASTPTKELYEAYTSWCDENLLTPESKQSFSRKAKQYFDNVNFLSHI